ncbi:MAG: DUF4344 domain-containing metallopeptidase [Gammaproteobacteria bacterium]
MKHSLSLFVSSLLLTTVLAVNAHIAVENRQGKTDQIRISYVPPVNSAHQEVYELLKQRKSLEKLKEFLSPYQLQWPLNLSLTGCDGEIDAMYSDDSITVCYEYIEELRKYMSEKTTPAGIEPIDTLIGPFVDTVLHEFAHALFDYLDVPILGREEDAADQVSAYIYLQLDGAEARRLIMGTTYAYLLEVQDTDPPTMEEFADEHSTSEQRAFNLLCMAYGSNPELFRDVAITGGLPQFRIDICEEEFELVSFAYETLIGPHVDAVLAEKIFDRTWLPEKTSRMLSKPSAGELPQ